MLKSKDDNGGVGEGGVSGYVVDGMCVMLCVMECVMVCVNVCVMLCVMVDGGSSCCFGVLNTDLKKLKIIKL